MKPIIIENTNKPLSRIGIQNFIKTKPINPKQCENLVLKKPLLNDVVFLSTKSKPKKLGFFKNFFLNQKIKIIPQVLEDLEKDFYCKTNGLREILIFEKKKKIAEKFALSKDISKQEKIDFFSNFEQDFFNNDLYNDLFKKLSQDELLSIEKTAKEKYFSQEDVEFVDLAAFSKTLKPKENDFVFRNKKIILNIIKKKVPGLVSIFENGEKISLNDTLIRKYGPQNEFYDLPYKFAIGVNNQKQMTGNSHIKEALPEIFQGIEESQLFSSLDTLSAILRKNSILETPSIIRFKIANQSYSADFITTGGEKSAYRINRESDNKTAIMKIYNQSNVVGSRGIFGNIAIEKEIAKDNCSDIPKFFFANVLDEQFKSNIGEVFQKGAWEIVEDVSDKTCKESTSDFLSWLSNKGLWHYDIKKENEKNGFFIDFGFIANRDINNPGSIRETLNSNDFRVNNLFEYYRSGKTTAEIFEELQKA